MKLRIAFQALCDNGVEFVVVDGVSANLHGSASVTFDLDICYSRTRANLRRLADALAPFRPRPRGFSDTLPFIWDEAAIHNSSLLTLGTDIGDIDLLSEISGVGTYDDVEAASVTVEAYGRKFAILDLRSL